MNKKLKVVCATLAIAFLPVGATCYAKTTNLEERYESIWVDAKVETTEKNDEAKTTNTDEYSIADVVRFKGEKSKCDAYLGKDIIIRIKVCKIKTSDDKAYIISKDSAMKKAKCILDKAEVEKCKEGDEVIVKGILKEIKGNKIILENSKILKVIDVNNNQYNKDKYKKKEQEPDTCEKKEESREEEKESKETNIENKEDKKVEEKSTDGEVKENDKEKVEKTNGEDKKIEDKIEEKKEEIKTDTEDVKEEKKEDIKTSKRDKQEKKSGLNEVSSEIESKKEELQEKETNIEEKKEDAKEKETNVEEKVEEKTEKE